MHILLTVILFDVEDPIDWSGVGTYAFIVTGCIVNRYRLEFFDRMLGTDPKCQKSKDLRLA